MKPDTAVKLYSSIAVENVKNNISIIITAFSGILDLERNLAVDILQHNSASGPSTVKIVRFFCHTLEQLHIVVNLDGLVGGS